MMDYNLINQGRGSTAQSAVQQEEAGSLVGKNEIILQKRQPLQLKQLT